MSISRRAFLARTAAVGCSAAASPLITPVTLASAPGDNRLVVIVLRGGMDGLHAVAPVGDRYLRSLRPTLTKTEFTDLDGFFALPPELAPLTPMWQAGHLAFAHAVSTPYRDKRSHFDGQDLLEAGVETVDSNTRDSGWLNRLLTLMPGTQRSTAFSVGQDDMLVLRGPAPKTSWAPEGRIDLSPQGQLLLRALYDKDPLFADAADTAVELVQQMRVQAAEADDEEMMDGGMMEAMEEAAKGAPSSALASFAARQLRGETRIASFSLGGWDTHSRQDRSMRRAMTSLADALLTLQTDLGPIWEKTTILAMTEFGRTVRENGSRGTDHGTGGAMVMAGGAVRGGKVYGDWPGLSRSDLYRGRDLMPMRDVRAYAGWVIRSLYGVAGSDVEQIVFPGVDLGANPGVVA